MCLNIRKFRDFSLFSDVTCWMTVGCSLLTHGSSRVTTASAIYTRVCPSRTEMGLFSLIWCRRVYSSNIHGSTIRVSVALHHKCLRSVPVLHFYVITVSLEKKQEKLFTQSWQHTKVVLHISGNRCIPLADQDFSDASQTQKGGC